MAELDVAAIWARQVAWRDRTERTWTQAWNIADDIPALLDALADANDRLAQLTGGRYGGHPEDYCHRCGGPNIVWYVDSNVWNRIMRADGPDYTLKWSEIICPLCFAELHGDAIWELRLDKAGPFPVLTDQTEVSA